MAGWARTLSEATARHRAWVGPHSLDGAFPGPPGAGLPRWGGRHGRDGKETKSKLFSGLWLQSPGKMVPIFHSRQKHFPRDQFCLEKSPSFNPQSIIFPHLQFLCVSVF